MGKGSSYSIDRLASSQLKMLLGLATRAELTGLPAQAADPGGVRRLLTELCRGQGESGDLLLETVCDPDTPVDMLRGVKDLSKRLLAAATTDAQRNAATILYHAAIAAGAAHHGVNLSSRPLASRHALYEDLAEALVGDPLAGVFLQAVGVTGVQ